MLVSSTSMNAAGETAIAMIQGLPLEARCFRARFLFQQDSSNSHIGFDR
jgi:hypothetical protein